jgi:hypothetical protein
MFFRRKPKHEPPPFDHQLMERGAIALYHKPSILAQDAAWFRTAGYRVFELDAGAWTTPAAFHTDVQRVLSFPSYYAKNLASWIDAIAELEVPDAGGVVLQFRNFDRFAASQRDLAQTILDSIEVTSRRFMLTGRRLIALVQSNDARIRFERVGAMPVTWNPREWEDSARGVGVGSS